MVLQKKNYGTMEKNYDNIPKTIKLLIYYVKTYGAIEKKNYGSMEKKL